MIYLLNAIGWPPGGSSTVHTDTQTVHRTTQNKQYIEHKQTIHRTTQNKQYMKQRNTKQYIEQHKQTIHRIQNKQYIEQHKTNNTRNNATQNNT